MSSDLENLAKNLAATAQGRGAGISIEELAKILSTQDGKRVMSMLLADGGEKLKRAAKDASSGDVSGIRDVISSVASTKEGADILSKIIDTTKER